MPVDDNQAKRGEREPDVLIRVLGSTLALLSFAVVCVAGLVQGHSFGSVVKSALVALAIGGAVGVLLAYVVRVVATEGFNRQFRQTPSPPSPAAAPAQSAAGSAQAGTPQAGAASAPAQPAARQAPATTLRN